MLRYSQARVLKNGYCSWRLHSMTQESYRTAYCVSLKMYAFHGRVYNGFQWSGREYYCPTSQSLGGVQKCHLAEQPTRSYSASKFIWWLWTSLLIHYDRLLPSFLQFPAPVPHNFAKNENNQSLATSAQVPGIYCSFPRARDPWCQGKGKIWKQKPRLQWRRKLCSSRLFLFCLFSSCSRFFFVYRKSVL